MQQRWQESPAPADWQGRRYQAAYQKGEPREGTNKRA